MTVNEYQLLEGASESSNLFKTGMTLQICCCFFLVFTERYVSRTNTNKVEEESKFGKDTNYFEKKVFKKSGNEGMAIKLNTFNTSMVDVQEEDTQQYLKQAFGEEDKQALSAIDKETNITAQQKCKFITHWIALIIVHA